ncbi:MAG: SpoIIE family protein phosphatase [Bacilli bacterium]|nr:SpoIIE family protein phosphatase [Bacilli bacterium]
MGKVKEKFTQTLDSKKAFHRNEIEANRQMCFACAFMAVALSIAFLLYIFKVFPLHNYIPVYIAMPIMIPLLLSPMFYIKTAFLEKSGFKYFILFLILLLVGSLNVLIPKHAVLGYALVLVLVNHYYSPKVGRIAFFASLATMLVCLYLGMFFGEYDPNLLGEGKVVYDATTDTYVIFQPESPQERYEYLQERIHGGSNRFAAVLGFYYFARAMILTLIFFACNALSRRTQKLLQSEVESQESKARIDTELSVAEDIQRTVLPNPTYQDPNVEILAQLLPAREVGGDFYDYSKIDENHVAVLIGDVSGKGVPAAMFMMKALTSFRASYSLDLSPAAIIEKVNRLLLEGNSAGLFATCFYGVLDIATGELRFANAGHCPPVLRRKGKYMPLPCESGFLLGSVERPKVIDERFMMQKGDALLLYTDGVTEAANVKGELYGPTRLIRFLNSLRAYTPLELGHDLEDSISEFCEGAPQSDDITYLNLVYQGEAIYCADKSFLADLAQGEEVAKFLRKQAEIAHVGPKIRDAFLLAMDEVFSNIVKYGKLPPGGEVYIRCSYWVERGSVSVTVVDHGIPFDPREVEETTVDQRPDDAPVGGLGWLMVRRLMDEIVYHRINGKNVISIFKKLK